MKKKFLLPTAAALFLSVLIFSSLAAPGNANAEPNWIIKNNEKHGKWTLGPIVSLMPWYFRTGIRVGIPVAPSGFIPTVNDEARIEIGGDFQLWWATPWGRCAPSSCYWCDPDHYNQGRCNACRNDFLCHDLFFRISFPVMLRWEFYLTKLASVYAVLGGEIGIPFEEYYRDPFGPHGWFWIVFGAGVRLTLKKYFALRLELGTLGLLFGMEFMF